MINDDERAVIEALSGGDSETLFLWQDIPRARVPVSPMHGEVVSSRELIRSGVYAVLNVGPWRGLKTTMRRLTVYPQLVGRCTECGCSTHSRGGACRITRPTSRDSHRCVCGHQFCGDCDRPRRYYCMACAEEITFQDGQAVRAIPPGPHVWGTTQAATYTAPFLYAPEKMARIGKIADIVEEIRVELRRSVYISLAGQSRTPYLTTDSEGRHAFAHYHYDCWGNNGIRTEGKSNEEIVAEAAEMLKVINLDSLRNSSPARLTPVALIRTGPWYSDKNWNRRSIDATTTEALLIRDVLVRQEGVGIDVPNHVAIVGCGGVGWHVATQLAMIGVPTLSLIDNDNIELSNLTRIPDLPHAVGMPKATRLGRMLRGTTWRELVPNSTAIHTFAFPIENCTLPEDIDVLVDSTDNIQAQRYIYDLCLTRGIRYVRAGYDGGWHISVSSRRSPDWEVPGTEGYAVPAWISGAMFAATLAVVKVCKMPRLEVSFDLRELLQGQHTPELELGDSAYVTQPRATPLPVEQAAGGVLPPETWPEGAWTVQTTAAAGTMITMPGYHQYRVEE